MILGQALERVIKNAVAKNIQLVVGKVKDVTDKNFTLVREGFADVPKVSLTAFSDSKTKIVTKPKEGSTVLVGMADGVGYAFLLQVSEVDSYEMEIAEGNLKVDSEGYFIIERQGKNLLQLLSDFITEVKKIVVVQGTSPDIASLTQLEQNFKRILK